MRMKRIQNRIAESRLSLPVLAVYGVLVCVAAGLLQGQLWLPFVLLALSTLLMVELNNANALIRIYSRMVSCSFLALTLMAAYTFASVTGAVVQLCLLSCYVTLFNAYQDKGATGWVFYSFLAIGTASAFFVQILFFVPVLWLLLAHNILALSWRTFFASLLGLIVPYWFVGGYYAYRGNIRWIAGHFAELAQFAPPLDFTGWNSHQTVTFCFIALLAATGIIHFLRNSYRDKIRTRMLYEFLIVMTVCTLVFMLLQPQHHDLLLHVLIINTAPLIGHFIALTQTRITNWAFVAMCAATLALTAYNLWIP